MRLLKHQKYTTVFVYFSVFQHFLLHTELTCVSKNNSHHKAHNEQQSERGMIIDFSCQKAGGYGQSSDCKTEESEM